MLAAAEAIAGDYVWGRYDLVVMPPSFPYGGMENPCLTFVTPTLLVGAFWRANSPMVVAGRRSLARECDRPRDRPFLDGFDSVFYSFLIRIYVLSTRHPPSPSPFSGNLVTNANWEHFWLNEGFTVFLERKIQGRLFGEKLRQFASQAGWEDVLLPTVNGWGKGKRLCLRWSLMSLFALNGQIHACR